ncbi:alkaline phosphatase D family protein [Nonomuraea indica]|uniref:alkaline phosphatase D family protein n=1 Tax=Nonomuraea indica TaxID=1581193 RepID=UPI001FE80A8F|nr:alkaline phosphatase D family protein [Nonomuraea indica]
MLDRRRFLALGLTAGLPYAARSPWRADPFTLGVASGDPSPDGFVLWTRLAPVPLAEDGLGGMPAAAVPVHWQVATDPGCTRVVHQGSQEAVPDWAFSVHVEVTGLRPDSEYWYRFRAGSYESAVGRAVTAPAPGSPARPLRLAVASCANYQHGYFTAYARLAGERPDLVLHLGDYIYEQGSDDVLEPGGNARSHEGPEATTLAGYRLRHALYKTDPDLRAAHAAAPWLAIMDDHEVANNWTGLVPAERRAAAFRAYYEHMPLRPSARPDGSAMRVYRRLHWGDLATFHLLDARQHRDPHPCGHGYASCAVPVPAGHSMIGAEQERWLLDGFRSSRARWDLVGQQVFFGRRDRDPGPGLVVRQDAWDGYADCRTRVTDGWLRAGVRNAVVLTGDVHAHWAGNLALDYDDPASPVAGTEFAVTSVTSGGDGHDADAAGDHLLAGNPHLRFHLRRRGYLLLDVRPGALTADLKVVPYVSAPGAPARSAATFTVADGVPGLSPPV